MRAQRAPHLTSVDAGITAIYGRLPLNAARPRVPAETLNDIFAIASDYERDMTAYGFSVVREAAQIGEQRMGQNPLPA